MSTLQPERSLSVQPGRLQTRFLGETVCLPPSLRWFPATRPGPGASAAAQCRSWPPGPCAAARPNCLEGGGGAARSPAPRPNPPCATRGRSCPSGPPSEPPRAGAGRCFAEPGRKKSTVCQECLCVGVLMSVQQLYPSGTAVLWPVLK